MEITGPVVVVGGANVDILARCHATAVAGTSNPGTATTSSGGVGRNIAENLARLGVEVHLVTAVGDDDNGRRLLAETAAAGVCVDQVVRSPHPTGSYTAVLDVTGELVTAVADMAATDALTPEDLAPVRRLVETAGLVVVDGNLAPGTVGHLLDLAAGTGRPVVLDPVSVAKAARLAPELGGRRPLLALTPNLDELGALTGGGATDEAGLDAAVADLHGRGVELLWVRLGARGSLLSRADRRPANFGPVSGEVVDVTGAGDAMLAAFVYGLLAGHEPSAAIRYGHAAAALTVATRRAVRADLTAELLEETGHDRRGTG